MLPQGFLDRVKVQLGTEYDAFLQSLERPRAVALRFRPKEQRALPFLGEPVPWEKLGYYYDPDARPGLHPFHEAGVYYLQEASAMAPVALLDPQPGERICDLCAAPGGKSTQIAGRLNGRGFLLANEIHPKRALILSRNMERMGVWNSLVTNETPARLARKLPGYFHRVLVDAPCSGEGMFRKEEAAVTDWSEETVEMCAQRQKEILEAAAELLSPGGRMVYSTCTFAPNENEEQIADFLCRHGEFSLETVTVPGLTAGNDGMYHLWPHRYRGEGQFGAVLRKAGVPEIPETGAGETAPWKSWAEFAKELNISLPEGKPVAFGQNFYWASPEMPDLKGLKVLRPGLALGEERKDRFLPDHALALWLDTCGNVQDYDPEEKAIRDYLHGLVTPSAKKGWCLVTTGGKSIGWGKGDGTVLKNHYPKGLRR